MTDTAVILNEVAETTEALVGEFFAKAGASVRDLSVHEQLSLWPTDVAANFFNSLTDAQVQRLPYSWWYWGRPKQIAPSGEWQYWLLLAGRGFGKTRSIVEFGIQKARENPGKRGAIVAATAADARDVLIEGESGFLSVSDPDFMPVYEPSKRRLTWPNGAWATIFSAEEPNRLRGPQFYWAIADEIAAWRYPDRAWDMLQFGLRLGDNPQCAVATTPRPIPLVRFLMGYDRCVVTHGTTYENRSNLADSFFNYIIKRYEGTRLGQQELNAALLEDVPGALWNRTLLEKTRAISYPAPYRIVVAVDPAATTGQTAVVVVAVAKVRGEDHGFVIDDVTPPPGALPAVWGAAAVAAYNKWEADAIVAEINHGGNMVETVIRSVEGGKGVTYKTVRASRGKYIRAEPVSTLFERGYGHLVGYFGPLEDELCTWVPGADESPNRLDAMVWGFTELMIVEGKKKAWARGA